MNIAEFARQTGLTAHTLRYYEQVGLLRDVARNSANHRRYSSNDLDWVDFIKRLRATGMSLDNIKSYADLRQTGESTLKERQQLLLQHAADLEKKISRETEHLRRLEEKIQWYENQLRQ